MSVTPRSLKYLYDRINKARTKTGQAPISYAQLAKDLDLSRSTVFQLLNDTYKAKTPAAQLTRQQRFQGLALYIAALADEHNIQISPREKGALELLQLRSNASTTPTEKALAELNTPAARKPKPHTRPAALCERFCCLAGYVTYGGKHYYAGTQFAGRRVTVQPLGRPDHGLRITHGDHTRDCYPVEAANNQLGYQPTGAAR